MRISAQAGALVFILCQLAVAQTPRQVFEKGAPAVALLLAGETTDTLSAVGSALVVREDGVLLTAYHVVKNAHALQVRFRSGDVFDDAQLLGIDARRDVAALKISATRLTALPVANAEEVKPGDVVAVISNAAALPWSVSTGVISAHRRAEEVPGAGSGYRLIQFTASVSPGSSGGVLIDGQGRALGLIVGSLTTGQNLNFAVPIDSVLGLANGETTKRFANGAALKLPNATKQPQNVTHQQPVPVPDAPEKSDLLKGAKDPDYILRNFKTMFVDARQAQYFGNEQMKSALGRNKGFAPLHVTLVDDPKVADVILSVSYTPAWDYPFQLKHQNTSALIITGKGIGPFSGPAGAASVASELVKLLKPYRETATKDRALQAR